MFLEFGCEEFLIIGIGGLAQGGRPPTVNIRYMNLVSVDFVCLWVESVGGGVMGVSLCLGAVTTHHHVKRDHPRIHPRSSQFYLKKGSDGGNLIVRD